jgi:hypothetical protein
MTNVFCVRHSPHITHGVWIEIPILQEGTQAWTVTFPKTQSQEVEEPILI